VIETIITREFWAESTSEQDAYRSLTIHLGEQNPQPKVTAQINLSRIEGRGNAKAFISGYQRRLPREAEPIYSPLEPPYPRNDPNALLYAPSTVTIHDAFSISFAVRVRSMFAYATCTVFVYHTTPFEDILVLPVRGFGSVRGGG
jgi:hypothetical protein